MEAFKGWWSFRRSETSDMSDDVDVDDFHVEGDQRMNE